MMRKPRGAMTIRQLKQSTDRRFDRMDRRFDRLEKELRADIARLAEENKRHFEEARTHFDMVAESLRDDMRLFADAIVGHSGRLDQHHSRLTRLERRTN